MFSHRPYSLLAIIFLGLTKTSIESSAPQSSTLEFPYQHRLLRESGRFVSQPVSIIPQSIPTRTLKSRPTTVYRPRSLEALHHARQRSLRFDESEKVYWDSTDIQGPDIEDLHTLAQLARMSGNAYALPGQKSWYDVDTAWETVDIF